MKRNVANTVCVLGVLLAVFGLSLDWWLLTRQMNMRTGITHDAQSLAPADTISEPTVTDETGDSRSQPVTNATSVTIRTSEFARPICAAYECGVLEFTGANDAALGERLTGRKPTGRDYIHELASSDWSYSEFTNQCHFMIGPGYEVTAYTNSHLYFGATWGPIIKSFYDEESHTTTIVTYVATWYVKESQ